MKIYRVILLTKSNTFLVAKEEFKTFNEAMNLRNYLIKTLEVKQAGVLEEEREEKRKKATK